MKHEKSIVEMPKFSQSKSAKCRKASKDGEKAENYLEIKWGLC